jgi:hypothetical protein
MNTSKVLVAMGAVSLMAYGSAIAQQAPSPSSPPSPASPPAASAQAGAQTQTASGELTKVDAKENELTVKTATGEITIKFDAATKVSGASRNTAGLATMSGSQVVVRYKKDGASNMAESIEVKPAAGAAPGAAPGGDRPSPGGGDRPSPGGDPSKPPTPRP